MKKTIAAMLFVLALAGCRVESVKDAGSMQTRHYNLDAFTTVCVFGTADVVYVPSRTYSVDVKAPEKIMEGMGFGVTADSCLTVYQSGRRHTRYLTFHGYEGHVTVTVHAPRLDSVAVNGRTITNPARLTPRR